MTRKLLLTTLCLMAASLGAVSSAGAHRLEFYNSYWTHIHTKSMTFYNEAGGSVGTEVLNAAGWWNNYLAGSGIGLTSVGYHDGSNVDVKSPTDYGATGWSGLMEASDQTCCDHYTHAHVKLNMHYNGYLNWQAVACQEIGHALGLAHTANGGCMAYTYENTCGSSGIYPTQHDVDDLKFYYGGNHLSGYTYGPSGACG